MDSLTLVLVTTALYLLYKLLSFIRFYIIGLRTGFPLILTPIFSKSILWQILAPIFLPAVKDKLPVWLLMRLEVLAHGWEFRWRNGEFQRMVGGDTFVVVCPDGLQMWFVPTPFLLFKIDSRMEDADGWDRCSNPALGSAILSRRKDFVQAPTVKQYIGIFGSNVLQVLTFFPFSPQECL